MFGTGFDLGALSGAAGAVSAVLFGGAGAGLTLVFLGLRVRRAAALLASFLASAGVFLAVWGLLVATGISNPDVSAIVELLDMAGRLVAEVAGLASDSF